MKLVVEAKWQENTRTLLDEWRITWTNTGKMGWYKCDCSEREEAHAVFGNGVAYITLLSKSFIWAYFCHIAFNAQTGERK